jgi:hypothetical protein
MFCPFERQSDTETPVGAGADLKAQLRLGFFVAWRKFSQTAIRGIGR